MISRLLLRLNHLYQLRIGDVSGFYIIYACVLQRLKLQRLSFGLQKFRKFVAFFFVVGGNLNCATAVKFAGDHPLILNEVIIA